MGRGNSKSQKQASMSAKNSRVIETKPYVDIVTAPANYRLSLHAVNMNFLLCIGVAPPLTVLIFEYANFYNNMFRYDSLVSSALATSLGLFKPDKQYLAECKQAEAIARNHIWTAGPLDALESEVKGNPALVLLPIEIKMELAGKKLTFVGSLLQFAIIFLDQTIQAADDSNVPMTDQGQAEMLMAFINEHMKHRISEAEEQARVAAPLDPEEASRKTERTTILNAALEQIKANNFDAAGKIILDYIIGTIPEKITDNRFFLGLLRMIPEALDLLVTRAKDLEGDLYGKQADQYCLLIGIIQRFLPFKLRKALETGVYYSLYQGRNINRTLDVSDGSYLKKDNGELGINRFFDDIGGDSGATALGAREGVFSKLMSAITSAQQNLCGDRTHIRRTMP